MKAKLGSLKEWLARNKWILLGVVLVTVFVFSNYVVGYKLSFSNVNYTFAPFDSTQTATDGPLLSDIADNHYPTIYKAFYSDEAFSFWESDIALGRPADSLTQYMNPMKWVYVMPFGLAIFLKVFSEFAIGFIGMYLFMRSIGLKKYAASLSAVTYIFSAAIVMWLGWSHSDVAVWAPLLFFAIEKLMETLKIKYMFLITLVVYVMLIVGMPTYTAYFMYLAGLYIVIFTVIRHWHQKRNIFIVGGLFAFGVILAVAASLPYTITLLSDVVGNGYMGSRTAYGAAQLNPIYLRTLLFPYVRDGMNVHINESTLYVGVLAITILPFAFCNLKAKKRSIFFIVSTVVLFLLIFTGVFNVIFTKIPMINTSIKYRVIVLLMFAMSALTGITLNDFLVNKEYYRKKPWLIAVAVVWIAGALLIIAKDLVVPYTKITCAMGAFMMVLAALITLLIKKDYKWAYVALAVLVVGNSAAFVRDYLPWIDADAAIIPEPTDSVTYMMENTANEERVVGLGDWTLFPNTPTFYDLNDVRTHGFEATNTDMRTYYETIDSDVYTTNTRHTFQTIQNYELFKYLGVKYIYGETVGDMKPIGADAGHSKAYGRVASSSTLRQTIALEDDPQMLSVLFATYGTTPESDGTVTFSLIPDKADAPVFEKAVAAKDIDDNSVVNVLIDTSVKKGTYVLEIAFDDIGSDSFTVWMKEQADSVVSGSNGDVPGAMAAWVSYPSQDMRLVYQGEDGLMIAEMTEYADKVELAESLTVCDTEEDVLFAMSEDYKDNAAFLVSDDKASAYDRPLEDGEGVTAVDYDNDCVTVHYSTKQERYLVLNDYFDKDWKAYVNGEVVPIEKINYMMRGVKVQAADDAIVEFRYEPTMLYKVIVISAAFAVITVLLFVFRKKLQGLIDAVKAKEDTHA